ALVFHAGLEIEENAECRHAGEAIHPAVMHLGVDGEAAVLEPLDEVVFPQRATAVERNGVQLRDQGPQLGHAAGLRQRMAADVPVEVELVVDDPDGVAEPERGRLEAAAIGRQDIEPRPRMLAKALEQILLAAGRLEGRHAPDMHRRLRRLQIEEGCVEHGKAFHGGLPATRRTAPGVMVWAPEQWSAISSTRSGTKPRAD